MVVETLGNAVEIQDASLPVQEETQQAGKCSGRRYRNGDVEEEKMEVNLVASDGASRLGEIVHTYIFISAEFISG